MVSRVTRLIDPVEWIVKMFLIMIISLWDILTLEGGEPARHDLVENVVRTLQSLLGNDTGFLQQVFILFEK